jgi:hypothetical protein
MNGKGIKIIYWVTTGLLTVIVVMYVGNSIFNHEMFRQRFASLGYPTYVIYPLTIAKVLGLIAIWSNKIKTLNEWTYAGFFFDFVLAMFAEMYAVDGEYFSSPVALTSLLISYMCWRKFSRNESQKIGLKV